MAIKKSQLYSSLWASADTLRGGMDASQYKDYILTLLFIKYVSDKFAGNPFGQIVIPEGASFDDLVKLKNKPNIGEEMDKLVAKLAEANNLTNIINIAHFNDEAKIGKGQEMIDKLTGLISIFQRPELNFKNNKAENDDLIGDAYEYLMRKFATDSGKSKGQFYTPAEVSRILAKVIDIANCTNKKATVYDPACGSGSLLIRAANEAPFDVAIYGQEKDISTAGLAKMNLVLHNKATGRITPDNTFSNPAYKDSNDKSVLQKFDYIVANPPFSMKNWKDGLVEFGRFDGYGDLPPEKNGDYAWLMHIIKSMKPETGKAAVILPHGVLFRGNAEETIRKTIINRKIIKGIIGLPANLFYGTGIPACIIVLDNEKAAERTGIFMIDASHGFMKDKDKNRLREEDIYKIVTTFNTMREEKGYSRFVPMDEITGKNSFNLNIPRYIDSTEKEDSQNIESHLYGGIPKYDIDNIPKFWDVFPNLKNEMFKLSSERDVYDFLITKNDIHNKVCENKDYLEYNKKINDAFNNWKNYASPLLTTLTSKTNHKELIFNIAEKIIEIFEPLNLLDKYDVYQVLLAYWNETMNDDVLLIINDERNYKVGNEVEVFKEEIKKGKNKGELKETGWDGMIIPKTIIADVYFSKEQEEIENNKSKQSQYESELEELIENNSDDSSYLNEFIKDDNTLNNTELGKRVKLLKKEKKTDTEEYELLNNAVDLTDKIKAIKKVISDLEKEFETKCRSKYATLSEDEIKDLLINKKWYKYIEDGIQNLYVSVANSLSKRLTELYERYENTLPELTKEVSNLEEEVAKHLKAMGFDL